MIQTRFRQCIKNVYRQYSTSSSASVAPRVGRTLHHNTRMLHQFRYEYSEDELSAELYRLNKSQNPLAAAKQKYYALEPLKTPADALQFVNYLLYTAKMNVARPAHLQATDSYFDYLLEQFEQFIPAFRPADLVSASIALSSANVPLYHPANRALTIAISRALQGHNLISKVDAMDKHAHKPSKSIKICMFFPYIEIRWTRVSAESTGKPSSVRPCS